MRLRVKGRLMKAKQDQPHRSAGTRRVLQQHRDALLYYLDTELPSRLKSIGDALESVIVSEIRDCPEKANGFVSAIDRAQAGCPKPEDFADGINTFAYAFVHLMDRYLRVWEVLRQLVCAAALPCPISLRVLDIGSGPASALYAASDFYQVVSHYGREHNVERLVRAVLRPCPIERQKDMRHFFHILSEAAHRPGPFHAICDDFTDFRPDKMRERTAQEETGKLADDPWPYFDNKDEIQAWANRLYQYQLVFFNYFLTDLSLLREHEDDIIASLTQQQRGGIVVVMGGTGKDYPAIHEQFAGIATRCGHVPVSDIPDKIGGAFRRPFLGTVKDVWCRIWQQVTATAGLTQRKPKNWRTYGDPSIPIRRVPPFGLRVFRKMYQRPPHRFLHPIGGSVAD